MAVKQRPAKGRKRARRDTATPRADHRRAGRLVWYRPIVEWPPFLPLCVVGAVLFATVDDRHVGRVPDERQIVRTAVAIAETGQIGQAAGRDFSYRAPDGRFVSRWGLGMSLVEVPEAVLAPAVERVLGAGSSQPLFLLPSLFLILAAAAFAGEAARLLGASPSGQRAVVMLTGLGSPLGAYGATASSEALQAAALAATFALSLAAVRQVAARTSLALAALGGFAASWAVLAKPSLIVVATILLLPLAGDGTPGRRARRMLAAAAGYAPGLGLWAWFEYIRFGRLFGAYPGETFSHPFIDGVWRLTIGPNAGLLWFFPTFAIAIWSAARSVAARDRAAMWGVLPPLAGTATMIVMAAGWWAWHGFWGWGPRLIVPAIPLLAAVAAPVVTAWAAPLRTALVVSSMLLNLPGLIQHTAPVAALTTTAVWPEVTPAEAAAVPRYARRQDADGRWRVSPDQVLAEVPAASPFVVYPWFFWANCCGSDRAGALATPPWVGARPDLVPNGGRVDEAFRLAVSGPDRAHFWGRGFRPSRADEEYAAAYDQGLIDQIIRLQQRRDAAGALRLANKLVGLAPSGSNDALVLECYRILGSRTGAREYLDGLSYERRRYPGINVVLALFERDAGNDTLARQMLGSVADSFPSDAPLRRALSAPLAEWPPDLPSMLAPPIIAVGR
jgi:hypothetical protein